MKTTKTNPAKLLLRYLWPRMQRGERHFIIDDTQLAFSMTAQQLSKVVRRFNETGHDLNCPVFIFPRRCSTSTASRSQPPEKPTPCLKERCYEDSPLTHHGRHGHARNVSMKMTLPTNKYVAEILEEANIAPLEVSMAILERKSVQELAEMFKSYMKDATIDQLLLSAEVSRKIGEIMIASVDVFEFLAKEKNHENQD